MARPARDGHQDDAAETPRLADLFADPDRVVLFARAMGHWHGCVLDSRNDPTRPPCWNCQERARVCAEAERGQ